MCSRLVDTRLVSFLIRKECLPNLIKKQWAWVHFQEELIFLLYRIEATNFFKLSSKSLNFCWLVVPMEGKSSRCRFLLLRTVFYRVLILLFCVRRSLRLYLLSAACSVFTLVSTSASVCASVYSPGAPGTSATRKREPRLQAILQVKTLR